MNKLGIHFGYFISNWHENPMPYFKTAQSLGFELFEIGYDYLLTLSNQELQKLADEATRCGLELSVSMGLPSSADPSSFDTQIRNEGLRMLKNTAAAMYKAKISSCSGIIHGAWNGKLQNYSDKNKHWQYSVATMKEAAKSFEDLGLNFNIEVVNRFENFLLNECNEAVQYLKEVESNALGIHLDTFHMNIEEDSIPKAITQAGSQLRFFHIGENNRKPPGLGNMNWKEIFDSLSIANYTGPISLEPFINPEGEVGAAVSLFRDIIRNNHVSREEMLSQSVHFIRSLYNESMAN